MRPQANSQVMLVLSAPQNFNPLAGRGGGEISIIQDSALLPVSGPLGSIADIEEQKTTDSISLYVVREGDTISEIAELFGVSANTIRWANELKRGSLITPGQVLVILPVSGIQYTAKKGDTLKSIAKKFGGEPQEIADFNGLALESVLEAGTSLIIPNGEAEVPVSTIVPKKSTGVAVGRGYYVRPFAGGVRTQGIHGYNGVDLASACGTPIRAAASGNVILAKSSGWNAGYGQYVIISHANGTQTLYSHLLGVEVANGWRVAQGQIIGYMGSTGLSTGCHVHFEVRGARNPF